MASVVITKIVLNNFKSYGQETLDNVDPQLNVIVGKNGHGKSNIHHGKKIHLFLLAKIPRKIGSQFHLIFGLESDCMVG